MVLSFLAKVVNISFSLWSEFWYMLLSLLFSHLVMSSCLQPDGLQHTRSPCPSPSPEVCPSSCPLHGDAIQPSHPLMPSSPSALNLSQHQGLFQWVGYSHQVTKILEIQFQHQSFQQVFRVDFPSVLFCEVAQSCPTLCNPMDLATGPPGKSLIQSASLCSDIISILSMLLKINKPCF